eukprot:TRINITY_DN4855_c0_g2_i1.p1 TRINITY_DN4855_c0_g2~~TRINITY_DN4855_c0_g2_i1.p1  ORF type:complete len:131 (+),score=25.82 TRINITY_DN4855_c0_g2_i1:80-472(+)
MEAIPILILALDALFVGTFVCIHSRNYKKSKKRKHKAKKAHQREEDQKDEVLEQHYEGHPRYWTPAQVATWSVEVVGFDRDEMMVFVENKISGDVLLILTDSDLNQLGFKMGSKKRLQRALEELKANYAV